MSSYVPLNVSTISSEEGGVRGWVLAY